MLPAGTKGFTETPQHIGVLGRLSEKAQIAVLAVDFNLAITAVDEEKGKISVLSAIIGFGGSSEASTENKSISSVKFTIPIALPVSIRPTEQPPAKAGGFVLRTESPDTRRLNDASYSPSILKSSLGRGSK